MVVVQILPEGWEATSFFQDQDNFFRFKRTWQGGAGKTVPALSRSGQAIAVADQSLAYNAVVPLRMERENPGEPLAPLELENMLAREAGRSFNQCRLEAAGALQADDLDMVLMSSRVIGFRVDEHKVLNPIGFTGGKVEAVLEFVLATRPVLEQVRAIFGREKVFFTESSRAMLRALEKVETPPLGFLDLGAKSARFAILAPAATGEMILRGRLEWGTDLLWQPIASEWSITETAARDIYEKLLRREVSASMERKLRKIIKPSLDELRLRLRASRLKGKVFVRSDGKLPFVLPHMESGLRFLEPPLLKVLANFGLGIRPSEWPWPESGIFRRLMPALEFLSERTDSEINQWLRRHLNWLGPAG